MASLLFAGVANAAPAPHSKIKPAGVWTQRNLTNRGCEVQTFSANGTWTADKLGDSGTWTKNGKAIAETWTAGSDRGQSLKAHWNKATSEFKGRGTGGISGGIWDTILTSGAATGC
jgi:hypothetical protein